MKRHHLFVPHRPNSLLSFIFLFICFFQSIKPVSTESAVWFETGAMNHPRPGHTATVLPNGKVLVAGGYNGSANLASAELYDPISGTWSVTGSMNFARRAHQAVLLPNGKVLVAGGDDASGGLFSAELYDPATGTWAVTGSMHAGRYSFGAVLLPNGKVL